LATGTYQGSYPNQQVDPRLKNYDWIIAYIKAAYKDSTGFLPFGFFSNSNMKLSEIKMYTMAKQSVDKYKKMFSPGNPTDPQWRAIDWTPPAFMCRFREISLSKLLQKKFDITAFPIDPIARSEEDAFFNQMKVKIIMREEAKKAGSPLADSPVLQANPGEPEDLEQLEIAQKYNYKHQMAIEAENAINLIFQQNQEDEIRKSLITSLYDWGIGAATQYIDENGMVKVRPLNMEYFGCSYFEKPDGSDMVHWYEVVPTFIADLAPYYTKEQLDEICKKATGKNGNPTNYYPVNGMFNQSWSRFKVMVLKCKFLSWNDYVYKEEKDSRGNVRFGRTSYENKRFTVNSKGELSEDYNVAEIKDEDKGEAKPIYTANTKKVRFKGSWIIDTDYMHDWGEDDNQNRKLSSWWDTDLDIQLYALNFYKMQFGGIAERLIPFEDRACELWFNLQNLSIKLIPYLINIDLNSVEAVNFGKGGGKSKPSEIIDFIFSNFVVPYRSTDLLSRNPNYKPVSIESTGQLAAFGVLYEQLEATLLQMQRVSGLNEATDASTIDQKTLNGATNAMMQATNNALYLISEAEKNILLRTADAIIQKVQIAVGLGKVAGYAKALGSSSVQFFEINPDIALHELGIYVTDALSEEQKQMLWQDINIKESQGFLDVADKQFLMQFRNTQQAVQLLSYKIQKRKEEQQAFEMQKIQEAAQGNALIAQTTEQLKQQTIQYQLEADLMRINAEGQWNYEIEMMKKQTDLQGEIYQSDARNVGHQIQGQTKIISDQITGELAKQKQEIANKKPRPVTKSK
jgi:hypothetical protein